MVSSVPWSVLLMVVMMMMMVCVRESEQQQLVIPLRHSLSRGASTTELIKRSTARSRKRNRKREVSLALSGGSDYTMRLQMGKGKEEAWVYMDTGSDLVWFPCRPFTCILCEGESPPLAPPLNASSAYVSCASPLCAAAHSGAAASDMCAAAGCPLDAIETSDCSASAFPCPLFYYAYADGSLVGRLHTQTVSVSPTLRIPGFTFACAHSALAEPVGVAGFGRGPLSMTAQLAPHIGAAFSYCLVSHSFNATRTARRPSPLILGRHHQHMRGFAYTAMLDNPKRPYLYSVALLGVSVGNATVEAPPFLRKVDAEGRGGMVVDSGTTFTMLPAAMHDRVVEEFERQLRPSSSWERAEEVEQKTGLMPCYKHSGRMEVPGVALRFEGGEEAVLLPRRNYWYEMRSEGKVGCLTVMNGGEEQEAATLGNYQQQGLEVVYDLENRRIGFANRKCDHLWDSLNPTP